MNKVGTWQMHVMNDVGDTVINEQIQFSGFRFWVRRKSGCGHLRLLVDVFAYFGMWSKEIIGGYQSFVRDVSSEQHENCYGFVHKPLDADGRQPDRGGKY